MPSVTRVFSSGRDLLRVSAGLRARRDQPQPLVAFVTFYRGEVKAFETAPLPVTGDVDSKTKARPVRFSVPLENLPPGRYECQVTVLQPGATRAAFWRAPVVVVP